MAHPVRSMIEALHGEGECPRIQVDLTAPGVVCPDFLSEQWGEELVIDLDPSYPLDLAFTDDAVEADLAFDGYVARCTFPFKAIYVVVDRETGKGLVVDENMPESVRLKRHPPLKPAPEVDPARADLAAGKRAPSGRRRRQRGDAKPEPAPALAPEPAAPLHPAPEPALEAVPEAAVELKPAASEHSAGAEGKDDGGEAEAKRRRAVFQVIDGDG